MAVSKKELILIGVAAVLIVAAATFFHGTPTPSMQKSNLKTALLTFGTDTITAEIAADSVSRTQGLSGRTGLAENSGMLFVFQQNGDWGFWMKDMLFPIDILFLGEKGEVITIHPNVSPATYPEVFYPESASRYVLELPAGYAAAHNMVQNSIISIPPDVQALSALQSN